MAGSPPSEGHEPRPAPGAAPGTASPLREGYERLVGVLQVFSAGLLLLMLAVVLLGVFYRYVVDQALSWYDEFAGYILVWLTMYGSVLALAKRKHISFDTLVEKLPPGGRRVAEMVAILSVMGFSAVLAASGWQLVREMADETSISLPWLKMAWIYSVLPISGGLMFLVGAAQLAQALSPRGAAGERARPMEEAQ
jgi:TRAP-type C4-dicarboxylate transport system permease small subunit